jgi:Uncharacterized conserved protein (DUF2278)
VPLSAYGVVIGDIVSFTRDDPDGFGSWYHGHLKVSTPSGVWDSALDVATPSGLGVRYRVSYGLDLGKLGPVASLATGFHLIASTPSTGAIDYLRSPFLQDYLLTAKRMATIGMPKVPVPLPPPLPGPPVEALGGPVGPVGPDGDFVPGRPRGPMDPIPDSRKEFLLRLLGRLDRMIPIRIPIHFRPWILSNGDNALTALEQHAAVGRRAYLFGQRYTSGNGVHDVHQNQGDPADSQWWDDNGIWQDGVVAVVQPDGKLFVWQVRFESQATKTDSGGHPA